MTFSYSPSIVSDIDLVRFHIGDTEVSGHFLEDETIQYFLDKAMLEATVLVCIRYIIAKLATPDLQLDWLKVSTKTAREGFEQMLKDKATEFGLSLNAYTISSSITYPYRSDSYMTSGDQDGAP